MLFLSREETKLVFASLENFKSDLNDDSEIRSLIKKMNDYSTLNNNHLIIAHLSEVN